MTCKEYYKEKYQIDISELHKDICNFIASNFLEHTYFSEEELKDLFKESKVEKSEKEEIVGGKADNKSIEDIAKKHNISVKEIETQLKIGLEIESEHTDSKEKAEEISKDHLWEFPDYYTRLKQMEKEAEKDSLEKGEVSEEEPLEDFMEKGKAAQVGEIREWGGVRMQKTNEGWVPVKESKSSKQEEVTDKKKTDSSSTDSKKEYSGEELKNFARQTSTEDLKTASEGADEKLRIAAKEELKRREEEESKNNNRDISLGSKIEDISDKYKDIVERVMNDDFTNGDRTKQISKMQFEYSRYLSKVNYLKFFDKKKEIDKICNFFELKSEEEVRDFFGDGNILGAEIDGSIITILTEDCYCRRSFNNESGVIKMLEFILDPTLDKGLGKGSDIFSNQVNAFKKTGYSSLKTEAAKSDLYNGYYTWARLGYSFSESSDNRKFNELISQSKNQKIRSVTSLSELMSFKEGREFWRKKGFDFSGIFDLSSNSESMFILNKYMEEKKNARG